jgi:hypothetical protein
MEMIEGNMSNARTAMQAYATTSAADAWNVPMAVRTGT